MTEFTDRERQILLAGLDYLYEAPFRDLVKRGIVSDELKATDIIDLRDKMLPGNRLKIGGTYWICDSDSEYNSREVKLLRMIDSQRCKAALLPGHAEIIVMAQSLHEVNY